MIRRVAVSLAGLLVCALVAPNSSRAVPLPMLTASSDTVNVGDTFTIPISIANVVGLTSFQFDLAFDHTIIAVLSFTDIGTDFDMAATAGGGSLTGITGFIDNTTGLLSGVADSMSGLVTGNGLAPSGVLVDIDFQALAPGISPLTLSNAFLTDNGVPLSSANGDFLLQNGQVTVIGVAPIPEPGTLLMLSLALAFAFCVHQGRKTMKHSLLAVALLAALALANGPVNAQLFQNGPYYANPSWDQQIPAAQRFIVLSNWSNAAVLDRETGLVWQRSPDPIIQNQTWIGALLLCHALQNVSGIPTGNRFGWRLPSVEELGSLIDRTQSNPALPAGHPFQNIQNAPYLTATTDEAALGSAYAVDLSSGLIVAPDKTTSVDSWCVRGGSGAQNPM